MAIQVVPQISTVTTYRMAFTSDSLVDYGKPQHAINWRA